MSQCGTFAGQVWGRRPHLFEERLAEASAETYDLQRVQEIIAGMDPADVICRSAAVQAGSRMQLLPHDGLADRLEERLSGECLSIMLQNLHTWDAVTADLLARFAGSVTEMVSPGAEPLRSAAAALFITSPGGVSSYHDDREQNFLVHLRGTKSIHVFPFARGLLAELGKATFERRRGIFSQYRPELEERAQVFDLKPGNTFYLPRAWPHWVQNGPEISVSLSLHFFTRTELWIERTYRLNDKLRAVAGRVLEKATPWR